MTTEELLANQVANFLAQAYGSPEAAVVALTAELAQGDTALITAGVEHSRHITRLMGEAMATNPTSAAAAILPLL
jgi:hypothetical protein